MGYKSYTIRVICCLFISIFSCIILPPHAFSEESYEIIDLGLMGGERSFAIDIINDGVVIGRIDDNSPYESRIFKWQDGSIEIPGSNVSAVRLVGS